MDNDLYWTKCHRCGTTIASIYPCQECARQDREQRDSMDAIVSIALAGAVGLLIVAILGGLA